jgi:hypothetical protein
MDSAEIRKLAAEASIQHGIRIDADDPIMAVVTLNRLALERSISEATNLIRGATQEFNGAVERVQIRAGSVVANEVRECVGAIRAEMQKDIEGARLDARKLIGQLHRTQSQTRRWLWTALGVLAGAGLFTAGVFMGIFLR